MPDSLRSKTTTTCPYCGDDVTRDWQGLTRLLGHVKSRAACLEAMRTGNVTPYQARQRAAASLRILEGMLAEEAAARDAADA